MRKIMKSQLFQLVTDKAIFIILIVFLFVCGMDIVDLVNEISMSKEKISGASTMIKCSWPIDIFIMLTTALIMVKDQADKTINYEIMSGRSRGSVFFGRFFTAFLICEVMQLIPMWGAALVMTAINGWGNELELSGALVRTLLMTLYVFRVCAETAFFSVLFKRKGIVYFMYLPVIMFDSLIMGWVETVVFAAKASAKKVLDWLCLMMLGLGNDITSVKTISVMTGGGKTASRYESYPHNMGLIILSAAGFGALFLGAAYLRFKRKDLE